MTEPKALRIIIPWGIIGWLAFMVACALMLLTAYTLLFPQWPSWAISDLTTATGFCAMFCWTIAGGRIV